MRGRKPDLPKIKRAYELKAKKLSNVEVARIMKCHEKQVRRYLKYPRTVIPT